MFSCTCTVVGQNLSAWRINNLRGALRTSMFGWCLMAARGKSDEPSKTCLAREKKREKRGRGMESRCIELFEDVADRSVRQTSDDFPFFASRASKNDTHNVCTHTHRHTHTHTHTHTSIRVPYQATTRINCILNLRSRAVLNLSWCFRTLNLTCVHTYTSTWTIRGRFLKIHFAAAQKGIVARGVHVFASGRCRAT